MAATDGLKEYNKQHVTIEGPNGVYVGKELDKVSTSISTLNTSVQTMGGYAANSAVATGSFIGNISGSTAVPIALTATQVAVNLTAFGGDTGSGGTKGVVPAPASGDAAASKFLKADGTWSVLGVNLTPYMQKANNLSDVASVSAAVATLGLTIGTNVQAFDAQLSSNVPQTAKSTSYTLVLTDGEKHIYFTGAGSQTLTIPANASVAYPVGTAVSFVNDGSASVSIAITTDTMILAGAGSTGTRTLAQYGMATAIKVTSTKWYITGVGLT